MAASAKIVLRYVILRACPTSSGQGTDSDRDLLLMHMRSSIVQSS